MKPWKSHEIKYLEYYNACRKKYGWSIQETARMAIPAFANRSYNSIREKLRRMIYG